MAAWQQLLACPTCKKPLQINETLSNCDHCGAEFIYRDGVINFLSASLTPDTVDARAMVEGYRQPNRLFQALRRVISSEYFPGKDWRRVKASLFNPGQFCLVIGSGVTRYEHAVHLDLEDFPNVDVVADAHCLPFQDASMDAVLCEVVLEHTAEPAALISEAFRVLKPGGRCLFITPFLFPYHGHPDDYRRWTKQGLQSEFSAFESIQTGIHAGPCSAMVNLMTEWCYIASGMRFPKGYSTIKGLATVLFFPLKFADWLVVRFPEAHRMASTLFITAHKPLSP